MSDQTFLYVPVQQTVQGLWVTQKKKFWLAIILTFFIINSTFLLFFPGLPAIFLSFILFLEGIYVARWLLHTCNCGNKGLFGLKIPSWFMQYFCMVCCQLPIKADWAGSCFSRHRQLPQKDTTSLQQELAIFFMFVTKENNPSSALPEDEWKT